MVGYGNSREKRVEIGYIYIIADGEGYIKVGVSSSPEKRMKQLQTGHASRLRLIYSEEFRCSRKHLLRVENMVHGEIGNVYKRYSGEWFKVDEEELEEVKRIVIWSRIRYEQDELYFEYR